MDENLWVSVASYIAIFTLTMAANQMSPYGYQPPCLPLFTNDRFVIRNVTIETSALNVS